MEDNIAALYAQTNINTESLFHRAKAAAPARQDAIADVLTALLREELGASTDTALTNATDGVGQRMSETQKTMEPLDRQVPAARQDASEIRSSRTRGRRRRSRGSGRKLRLLLQKCLHVCVCVPIPGLTSADSPWAADPTKVRVSAAQMVDRARVEQMTEALATAEPSEAYKLQAGQQLAKQFVVQFLLQPRPAGSEPGTGVDRS